MAPSSFGSQVFPLRKTFVFFVVCHVLCQAHDDKIPIPAAEGREAFYKSVAKE